MKKHEERNILLPHIIKIYSVLTYHLFNRINISPVTLYFFTDDTLGLGFETMVQALLPGQCVMNLIILL